MANTLLYPSLPDGYTPVLTDIVENVWLLRNPYDQSQTIQILPYSAPTIEVTRGLHSYKAVKWADVRG